jgi:molecular chaperone DnaK (HSP70)
MAHPSGFPSFQRREVSPLTDSEDTQMTGTEDISISRFIIAVDFGTTFSSVAYSKVTPAQEGTVLTLRDVSCVSGYPGSGTTGESSHSSQRYFLPREDVPTEIWYPNQPKPGLDRTDAVIDVRGSDSSDIQSSDEEPDSDAMQAIFPTLDRLYWGFDVQNQMRTLENPEDTRRHLKRFKLMLDAKSELTEEIRVEIGQILRSLKRSKVIRKDTDVIDDYLTELLKHTRTHIEAKGWNPTIPTEFVICVPALWPSKACRIMQAAMGKAVQNAGLRDAQHGEELKDLFIVSEPEAAATCIFKENRERITVSSESFLSKDDQSIRI